MNGGTGGGNQTAIEFNNVVLQQNAYNCRSGDQQSTGQSIISVTIVPSTVRIVNFSKSPMTLDIVTGQAGNLNTTISGSVVIEKVG